MAEQAERTPEEWLAALAAALEARRNDPEYGIRRMRGYSNGRQPLPEMAENLRPSWEAFQKRSRVNWGGKVISAMMHRIVYAGVSVDGTTESPAAKAAALIVRNNRLSTAFRDALRDCLATGYGYLVVGDDDGEAIVTRAEPDQCIVQPDPLRPWRAVAALRVWTVEYEDTDHAALWLPGALHTYTRAAGRHRPEGMPVTGTGWTPGPVSEYTGNVPVYELRHPENGGELGAHTPLLDRIALGVLWRLVIQSMQAYRQRAIIRKEGAEADLVDEEGNPVDLDELLTPAPGALWDLPPGVELWESQAVDLRQILDACRQDLRELGEATDTPLGAITSDSANQSAEGARGFRDALAAKVSEFLALVTPTLEGVLARALEVEGHANPGTVAVQFEPPTRVTLGEKIDAASKAPAAGMGWESVQVEILGRSAESIDRDRKEREANPTDMARLAAALARPGAPTPEAAAEADD